VSAVRALASMPARLACLALLALPAGCSMFGGAPKPVQPVWQQLAFAAAADANDNSALAVDVVLVKDKAMLDTLAAMPAARYFAAKADLQRTYPDALKAIGVEITPGQLIRIERGRFGAERAWAALAFANYAAPGEHRLRVPLDSRACVLRLDAQEFAVTDSPTGPAR
jgi:type VI secretion system protein